jgi:uncharacterized membrane protein
MTEAAQETRRRRSSRTEARSSKIAGNFLLGIFVIATGVWIAQLFFSFRLPLENGAWGASVLVLALAATLISLSAQLPAQNVLLAAVVIAFIGFAMNCLGSATGIPFGPVVYPQDGGPLLFTLVSWTTPLIWIIAILSSRGVARLILRPWRKIRAYGFWLIGVTTVLALLFDCGLEPFATRVAHLWLWRPTKITFDWYGTPVSNFLGWIVTALLILAFSTPALMKRKPAKSSPNYPPLVIWTAINLLFIAGMISQHLWLGAIFGGGGCLAAVVLSVRGALW